ncbi:MAG: hypothetical protein WC278_05750 [Bacilli bacterium]|jgi:hypothetical protein|nr:hypothetical protein [Acholeplasmataceae bacterium]MDY0364159.1 hypothetical protein [Bacilli bacterium]
MYIDSTGEFPITLAILGLIIGAVVGTTVGGVIAYNVAKDHGAEGWDLFGWTSVGALGGGLVGGAFGAGAGALVTHFTGITGLSVTKYSITFTSKVTVLGHTPGYIAAAKATGSGYYLISDDLYNKLQLSNQGWSNNLQYLKDAHKLGTQFVVALDFVVRSGGILWQEIQYLVEQGIAWIFG